MNPSPSLAHWPPGTIFTVGHSTLAIGDFIALLRAYGIAQVADIRSIPKSWHNPQFNADALGESLAAAAVHYLPMPALGGLRHSHKDSPNGGWRNKSFRGYADYMLTPAFAEGLKRSFTRAGRSAPPSCARKPCRGAAIARWWPMR